MVVQPQAGALQVAGIEEMMKRKPKLIMLAGIEEMSFTTCFMNSLAVWTWALGPSM